MDANEVVEMAVKVGIVRRDGRGPWGGLHECLDNEDCFARGGDNDSVLSAVRSLAAEFFADFTIDFRGDEDAAAGFRWEIGQAGEAAGVVGFGEGEATNGRFMDAFRGAADGGGREIEPRRRKIAASVVVVFAGVAGDVGELQGDAEVDGVPRGGGLGGAEDTGHHEPNRAGHAVAVAEEGAFVGDLRRTRVVAQGAGQGDGGGGIGIFEREIKRGEGIRGVPVFEGGGNGFDLCGIAGFVGEVIESATEGVELGRGLAAVGREEFAGEVETFAGAGEEFFRSGCAHEWRSLTAEGATGVPLWRDGDGP